MEALMSSPATHIDGDRLELRAPKSANLSAAIRTAAAQVIAAVREGLTSMHRYEDLRAHGSSHAIAANNACKFTA
jgi:hypothetical protein